MKTLIFVVNTEWFFLSHKLYIGLGAIEQGYRVIVCAAIEKNRHHEFATYGIEFVALPMRRGSKNIFYDIALIKNLRRIYKQYNPDIVHHITLKPIVYGTIVARALNIPKIVNTFAGMGSLYIDQSKHRISQVLLKSFLGKLLQHPSVSVIVQNSDDKSEIEQLNPYLQNTVHLILGSGVDIQTFACKEEPSSGPVRFILASRLLYDKGIIEYIEAGKILKQKYGASISIEIAGDIDTENPTGIPETQIQEWFLSKDVLYHGHVENMYELLSACHVMVLPSYREGLSKFLLEACAIGRPIITTDVPGCREIVKDGENGFLVPAKHIPLLAEKMEILLLHPELRKTMGTLNREKAEQTYAKEIVVAQTLEIYNS